MPPPNNKKPKKIKAGVVGWPISHSLSPQLHGYWLEKYEIDGSYQAFAVRPEALANFMGAMEDNELKGINLTVPHKEAVLPFLSQMDETARKVGAVNMVTRGEGEIYGCNTDGYGFLANLHQQAPDWSATDGPALILGAGGAARAAIVSLLDAGIPEIRLLNRTIERAAQLVEQFNDSRLQVHAWTKRDHLLDDIALLVNVTTLGMTGQPPLEIDLSQLVSDAVVYDIVYNPLETALLIQARARGNICVDGLGMLLHQAVPAFEAWFGVRPEIDESLRQYMCAGLKI